MWQCLLLTLVALTPSTQTASPVVTEPAAIREIHFATARGGPAAGVRDPKLEPIALFNAAMPAGVAASSDERVFVSFPPWGESAGSSVLEISKDRQNAPLEAAKGL